MKYILLLFGVLMVVASHGQDVMKADEKAGMVVDSAGFLTAQEEQSLELRLKEFNRQTSTQIAVVIVRDLKGYAISDYAFRIGEQWGVGQKDKDNGIVVLIKPKTSASKGKAFIATGYGVEDVVPDAVAKRIVEYEMIPEFKNGNYFQGVHKAVTTLMDLTKRKYTAKEYTQQAQNQEEKGSWLPFFIFLGIIFFSVFGRLRRARRYSIGHGLPFWAALTMMSAGRSAQRGSFGSFSSGSGSFGGFGGGSFGGGGAGGSW